MIEYKGYTGVVEYDPEIEAFSGYVIDLRDQIHFEGESVEEVKAFRAVQHTFWLRASPPDRYRRSYEARIHERLASRGR